MRVDERAHGEQQRSLQALDGQPLDAVDAHGEGGGEQVEDGRAHARAARAVAVVEVLGQPARQRRDEGAQALVACEPHAGHASQRVRAVVRQLLGGLPDGRPGCR
jgi:hypothetical protein